MVLEIRQAVNIVVIAKVIKPALTILLFILGLVIFLFSGVHVSAVRYFCPVQ